MREQLTVLKNIVRVGTVSSVRASDYTARVAFHDKLDSDGRPLISGALKVIQNQPIQTPPWMPSIGQFVVCIYLPNGESDGFVIGGIL